MYQYYNKISLFFLESFFPVDQSFSSSWCVSDSVYLKSVFIVKCSFVKWFPVTNVLLFRRMIYFPAPPPLGYIYLTENFFLQRIVPLHFFVSTESFVVHIFPCKIFQCYLFRVIFLLEYVSLFCIYNICLFQQYVPFRLPTSFLFLQRWSSVIIFCLQSPVFLIVIVAYIYYFHSHLFVILVVTFDWSVYYDPVEVVYHTVYLPSFPEQILFPPVLSVPSLPSINFYPHDNFFPVECFYPFQIIFFARYLPY